MKKLVLTIFLLVPTFFWAVPNPDEYSINVHVTASYFVMVPGAFSGAGAVQKLNVLIDGKKYELSGRESRKGLLTLGDYKARLVLDEHKTSFESRQEYELLMPDKTTKKFYVSGQTE